MGLLYHDARRISESEKAYNKALTLYEELAQKPPDKYNHGLTNGKKKHSVFEMHGE
jgi:hypothetical protein